MKTHHWFTEIMLVWLSVLGGSLAAQTAPTAFVKGLEPTLKPKLVKECVCPNARQTETK